MSPVNTTTTTTTTTSTNLSPSHNGSSSLPPPPPSSTTTTTTTTSSLSAARYPLSRPLATILRCAMTPPPPPQTNKETSSIPSTSRTEDDHQEERSSVSSYSVVPKVTVVRESMEEALGHFVRNSLVAIDGLFFSTPPSRRNRPTFRHRLCIRISTSVRNKTLTITDLGIGMNRSDLINALGVGACLGTEIAEVVEVIDRRSRSLDGDGDEKKGEDVGGESEDGGDGDSSSSEEEEEDGNGGDDASAGDSSMVSEVAENDDGEEDVVMEDGEEGRTGRRRRRRRQQRKNGKKAVVLSCKKGDIGGFYAGLCALGVGVEIGTKAKFDDYYEFKILPNTTSPSKITPSDTDRVHPEYSHFTLTRPLPEGEHPSSALGFSSFTDVRGESGTKITLTLSDAAVQAGFLDEEGVLRPILEKIMETSEYEVALEGCRSMEEREELIEASRREEEEEGGGGGGGGEKDVEEDVDEYMIEDTNESRPYHSTAKERAKYIPLRLSLGERKMLRLVTAAITCCDYTDSVDRPFKSPAHRIHAQLRGISSVLRGIVTSCDYDAGRKILEDEEHGGGGGYGYAEYQTSFRQMFEIARRHKIMNPEKMRTEYGKLIYLLQDAVSPSVRQLLSFSCKGKVETVYTFLERRGGVALLDDELIDVATREILAGKKSRTQITAEIKRKEKAVEKLKQTYRNARLKAEDIHLCLYSICDNDSFLNSNRVPIDKTIAYLRHFFSPAEIDEGYSLSIVGGQDGARLSHSHERQYYFALQSLTLWRDVVDDMFRLWAMAEEDLLSESVTYSLEDTGQGMQRVQQSPRTYKSMQQILTRVQGKVKQWIGSNVIHLGDHNVPNAFIFIDKYTQVPRILGPIVSCLENLERICEEDDGVDEFVTLGFGGVEQLKKDILYDFFKSAFDGSGADNFYDAGSCIDGRLTSAWNWCSQLPSKPFFCIFKLTGFTGFDGEFK